MKTTRDYCMECHDFRGANAVLNTGTFLCKVCFNELSERIKKPTKAATYVGNKK